MWVAIAAVGCALAVVGLFLISGDAQAGDSGEDGSNVPGIILSLLVVLAGYALMHLLPRRARGERRRHGRDPGAAGAGVVPDDRHRGRAPRSRSRRSSACRRSCGACRTWSGPGRAARCCWAFALAFAWLFALQVVEDPFSSGNLGDTFEPGIIEDDPFARRLRRRRVRRGLRRRPSSTRTSAAASSTRATGRAPTTIGMAVGAVRRRLPGAVPGCSTSGTWWARPPPSSWPGTSRCITGIVRPVRRPRDGRGGHRPRRRRCARGPHRRRGRTPG